MICTRSKIDSERIWAIKCQNAESFSLWPLVKCNENIHRLELPIKELNENRDTVA